MNTSFDRRHFLRLAAAGASASVLAACAGEEGLASTDQAGSSTSTPTSTSTGSSDASAPITSAGKITSASAVRRLVVIEMSGGNDGMSTLVPSGVAGYRDLRKRTALKDEDLVKVSAEFTVPKSLGALHKKGLAFVMGVGSANPDGSHFEMMDRWWKGDPKGGSTTTTGFLGRLADAIGDPAARAVAVSIGSGSHPALVSKAAPTMSIPRQDIGQLLARANTDDKMLTAFQTAMREFAAPGATGLEGFARKGTADALRFAETLGNLTDEDGDGGYPGTTLAGGLRMAARLFAADPGVRIVHVPFGADFDTHEDHNNRHGTLMTEFNEAVLAFLKDLEKRKLDDSVLVATTSEFGRTAADNGSGGLDHGAASVVMLAGAVKPGLYGEYSPLKSLDDRGNLRATVGLDQYYATIAQGWFGVPSTELLKDAATPLSGLW